MNGLSTEKGRRQFLIHRSGLRSIVLAVVKSSTVEKLECVKKVRFFGKNYFLLVFHFVRKPQKTIFSEKALPILLNLKLF